MGVVRVLHLSLLLALGVVARSHAQCPPSRLTWKEPEPGIKALDMPEVHGMERGLFIRGLLISAGSAPPGASIQVIQDTLRVIVQPLNLTWWDTRDEVTYLWQLDVALPEGEWNVEVRQGDRRKHASVRVGSRG
jgi:hypothetical protein